MLDKLLHDRYNVVNARCAVQKRRSVLGRMAISKGEENVLWRMSMICSSGKNWRARVGLDFAALFRLSRVGAVCDSVPLGRTQRSRCRASSVPQLLRSIGDELSTVLDGLCLQDRLGCDREALAEVIQTRLQFTQKPIHLLAEWLEPTTYTNVGGGELAVSGILAPFALHKDGAWRDDLHAVTSELEEYWSSGVTAPEQ